MSTLYWMTTITGRSRLPDFLAFYRENKTAPLFITLASGTATRETLNFFGLDSSEKAVCFSLVTEETWQKLKTGLQTKLQIDVPGTGIAFIVPLSSIGGKRELQFLTAGQQYQKGVESTLKETSRDMLVIIANQGYSEQIMDAARGAGAAGGTVIHARGTGMEKAEQFFGVSLAAEKEMIFVVVRTEQKNAIMDAIMREAGVDTRAGAIVFSLPVNDTAGLRLLENSFPQ